MLVVHVQMTAKPRESVRYAAVFPAEDQGWTGRTS